jgi:hypothetical protein
MRAGNLHDHQGTGVCALDVFIFRNETFDYSAGAETRPATGSRKVADGIGPCLARTSYTSPASVSVA